MDTERFGGIARLYGLGVAEQFAGARVAVVGIGGVGSWAAEALARSGVGSVVLMDLDDICITNTNRQIHAHAGQYGQLKVEAMAQRLLAINPAMEVIPLPAFYSASKPELLFEHQPAVVIDAIDTMRPKAHLIAECYHRGIPVVTCGGAGGRSSAAEIRLADLARTTHDSLLGRLRKLLRQDYGLPLQDRCPDIGIPCVFSTEAPVFPRCDGSVSAVREEGQHGRIGCASGFGSATHITGTFGFFAAGAALQILSAAASGATPSQS